MIELLFLSTFHNPHSTNIYYPSTIYSFFSLSLFLFMISMSRFFSSTKISLFVSLSLSVFLMGYGQKNKYTFWRVQSTLTNFMPACVFLVINQLLTFVTKFNVLFPNIFMCSDVSCHGWAQFDKVKTKKCFLVDLLARMLISSVQLYNFVIF